MEECFETIKNYPLLGMSEMNIKSTFVKIMMLRTMLYALCILVNRATYLGQLEHEKFRIQTVQVSS